MLWSRTRAARAQSEGTLSYPGRLAWPVPAVSRDAAIRAPSVHIPPPEKRKASLHAPMTRRAARGLRITPPIFRRRGDDAHEGPPGHAKGEGMDGGSPPERNCEGRRAETARRARSLLARKREAWAGL